MDHALGLLGDVWLVGDEHDGAAFFVQSSEDPQNVLGGARVEVPGGLIGEDHGRVRDQRARDRDPLLLAAGELGWLMVNALCHTDRRQRLLRALAARVPIYAGVGERQFDVRECGCARDQVEALKDEADLAVAQVRQVVLVHVAHVDAVYQVAAARR